MALSQSPARTATKKQRKPDPARVVQSYWHEVQTRGKRGALRRTGELYNISDESVRRYVAQDEQRSQPTPALPAELAYTPAPGEASYQAERERIAAQLAAEQRKALTPQAAPLPAIRHKPRPHCHRLSHGLQVRLRGTVTSSQAAFERGTVANDAITPHRAIATRHSPERAHQTATAPATPQDAPPAVSGAPAASVKRYAPRPAPVRWERSLLAWLQGNLFAPGPALALLAFLLLVLLLAR